MLLGPSLSGQYSYFFSSTVPLILGNERGVLLLVHTPSGSLPA